MAYDVQVVVDCDQPHVLADWWAETLGWEVEEQDAAFIRKMIAEGYADASGTSTHHGKLVWSDGASIRHPDSPAAGPRKRILFQLVPETKTIKNRLHLDVWVGQENVAAKASELVSRGAMFLHEGEQGPQHWITLADPDGNEFCIQ
jgi:hypothetical protein